MQDLITQEIDDLLQSLSSVEDGIGNLPNSSLDGMLTGLELILKNLELYRKEAERLKDISQSLPTDPQTERLLNEIQDRVDLLILRSQQGVQMIENAMHAQQNRKDEISKYQSHLDDIETWLADINIQLKQIEHLPKAENELSQQLKSSQEILRNLKEKEQLLVDLQWQTKELQKYEDVSDLAYALDEHLQMIINALKKQITMITTRIYSIETTIAECQHVEEQVEPVSLSENTIDSTSMPEEEMKPIQAITVETQTSDSLTIIPKNITEVEAQTSFPLEMVPAVVSTVETSMQTTKERKPTENILVTQTTHAGHETIQIDTIPNKTIPDVPEEVLVEARYHQRPHGDIDRSTELVMRNVPESFETTFVEPDETTTEVVVDPDGTKRIIVKKLTRTHHQITQRVQQQQISTVSTLSENSEMPELQSVHVVNLEKQETSKTLPEETGIYRTIVTHQTKGSVAKGSSPDTMIVQEFETAPVIQEFVESPTTIQFEGMPVHEGDVAYVDSNFQRISVSPEVEHTSSIRAVVQQVSRKIIRKTRKIIKRVVIIDGKEHITEEIVEEPEEIEISEEELPAHVNVNIIRTVNGQVVSEDEYNKIMREQAGSTNLITDQTIGKTDESSHLVSPQVLEFDQAQVEFTFDNAPKVDVTEVATPTTTHVTEPRIDSPQSILTTTETTPCVVHTTEKEEIIEPEIVRETILISEPIEETKVSIENIEEIWPPDTYIKPLDVEPSQHDEIENEQSAASLQESLQSPGDEMSAQEVWPINEVIGSPLDLEHYVFNKEIQKLDQSQTISVTVVDAPAKEIVSEKVTIEQDDLKDKLDLTETPETEKPDLIESVKDEPTELVTIKKPETSLVAEKIETTVTEITTVESSEPVAQGDDKIIEQVLIDSKSVPEEFGNIAQEQILEKPTIDIRTATQMFISGESISTDLPKKIITVTAPTIDQIGESVLKVRMDADPSVMTKVNVNIVETEEVVPRTDLGMETIPHRKKKKRKDKEEKSEQLEKPEPEITICDDKPEEIIRLSISEVETVRETGYEADDKTMDEGDIDRKKKRKKKKKQKVKHLDDEDSHIPASSDDGRDTDSISIKSDGKIREEIVTEISPESEISSISEDVSVKIIEEAVLSPESESPRLALTELVIPTEVLEVAYVDDEEQQTTPREELPRDVIEPKELKSAQTSPEHRPIISISQQTSVEVPDVHEEESQTILVESTEIEIQTTPRQEETIVREDKPIVELTVGEMQTDDIPRPDIEIGVQESPETVEFSSQTTVIKTTEQELQTTPIEIPQSKELKIESDDIVVPLASEIITNIVRDLQEPKVETSDQHTLTEIIPTADSTIQTTPREDILELKDVVDVDVMPSIDQQTTTEIISTVESEVQTTLIEDPYEDFSSITSTSISEPYNLEIQTTVAIPPDTDASESEPVVFHYSQTVELPKPLKESRKQKKSKKIDNEKDELVSEVNISVEIDQGLVPAAGVVVTTNQQPIDSTPINIVEETHSQGSGHTSPRPNLVQLSISRTTTTTTFPIEGESIERDKVVVTQKPLRQRPTSSVMIEEVMSPTEELDVPLTPGLDNVQKQSSESIWQTASTIHSSPTKASQDLIQSESMMHYRGPIHKTIWTETCDAIGGRIRHLKDAQKPTALTNVLHLATLDENITEVPVEERIRDVEQTLSKLDEVVEKGDSTVIQTTVITVIEKVSTWLETIEYRVYLIRQQSNEGPSEEKVEDYNQLNDEINTIKQNVTVLETSVDKAKNVTDPESQNQMNNCVETLKEHITAVEEVTKENQEQDTKDLERWNEFLVVIHEVTTRLNNLQEDFEIIVGQDIPINTKLLNLDQLETQNRDELSKISKLINTARSFLRDFPGKKIPQDIYDASTVCKNLEKNIVLERERVLQLQSLSEEYEQTLKEFANIALIADRLVETPVKSNNWEQLHDEMSKHLKFFANLNKCRTILESLEENIDTETREKHADFHKELYNRATHILEKASDRAQKLAQAASKWTSFEKGMKDERQWLQVAQQRVPDLSAVTSADYDQYTTMYQSLNTDISHHYVKMSQLSNLANKLQDLVQAPHLVEESNEALIVLLKLREEVALYLHRILVFKETWGQYESQSDKLEIFVRDAERELGKINIPEDPREQPIEHMRQFWEIKAQFEMHNNIRLDSANSFEKSLKVIPLADEILQRQFHSQLENRWADVSKKIGDIENAIVNNISSQDVPDEDKLVLLERELKEIYLTMTSMKGVIKNEEELSLYIERIQVLNTRVGIIGNELGRLGLQPAIDPEKIGSLFALSHKITVNIAEELECATILRDRLTAIQDGIQSLRKNQTKLSVILDDAEAAEKLSCEEIQKALDDCKTVGEDLSKNWQQIMRLRQMLHTLPLRLKMSVSPVKLERDISHLQDDHDFLESRRNNIISLLNTRLLLWHRYEKQLELVHESVQEADFMMELLKVHGQVDYERLRKATERLEGLSGDLQNRESLLENLKSTSLPLIETCDGAIVEQIEAAVQEAVVAWNDTSDNLQTLVTRYHRAVELWDKYRNASDAVKLWAENQMDTLDTLNQPLEPLQQVKVCEEDLSEHNNRLSELREMVSQIAADVGLDSSHLLQDDLASLGRRLEDVKESITKLANVAEARDKDRKEVDKNVLQARAYLNNVQQDISRAPTNAKESEDQLLALRSHLQTLTHTEEQLKELQDKNIEIDNSDASILEVLELWQKIFRDTFQEYHRLSSRLVSSQNSTEALKLWRQYLQHVQSFLSCAIPEDYSSLKEHRHLCEVHQNLLTSQQSVLSIHTETDATIANQFNVLTGLHNETLSRIMSRNAEIEKRMMSWNAYKLDLTALLEWLKEREMERSKLQLRYIHLKRVPKLKQRIELLLEQIPVGENMAAQIKKQQINLLQFCDDALATSIRMEHASASQRINNLSAALETWRGFLTKIEQLSIRYDDKVNHLQEEFAHMQKVIETTANKLPTNSNAIQERLSVLRNLRIRLSGLTQDLEQLNVTQEELKECISPHDMKSIRQTLWILWQQHADIDSQLSGLINTIEERLSLNSNFNSRYDRVFRWIDEIEKRIEKETEASSMRDPEDIVKSLETEIQSEMQLREKEREWLLSTGRELLTMYDENSPNAETIRAEIQYKTDMLIDRWDRLKYLVKHRTNKINDLKMTFLRLEERIAQIRQWMFEMETELSKPLTFDSYTRPVIEAKQKEHEKIQKAIEKESANIGEVFNLCEMLLNDADTWKAQFNSTNMSSNVQNLEKRWRNVCSLSSERKRKTLTIWNLLQELIKLTSENKGWLVKQESDINELERDLKAKLPKNEVENRINNVEQKIKEIESQNICLRDLEQAYAKLAMIHGVDPENIQKLIVPTKVMLTKWKNLVPRCYSIIDSLNKDMKIYREFMTIQGSAVASLTDIESKLAQLQEPNENPDDQFKQLERLEKQLKQTADSLQKAETLGAEAKRIVKKEDIAKIILLMSEYKTLCTQVTGRVANIKKDIITRVANAALRQSKAAIEESVLVSRKFETDAGVQVDTMTKKKGMHRMTSITPKDAYIMELGTSIKECQQNLDELQLSITDRTRRPGPQRMSKLMATCESSTELMKHLSTLLLTECAATNVEAEVDLVNELMMRFERLQAEWKERQQAEQNASEVGRLTCPLCTQRNWQQIDNDLWRLEQWLQFAEGTQSGQSTPPTNIELLEDIVQDHREFLLDLESHKSIIASLNVVGDHLATHTLDTEKARQLRARLETDNDRWNKVCLNATKWQGLLQTGLMGNREFHQIIDELCVWLQQTEQNIRASEPVDLTEERSLLDAKFRKFKELRAELERCEPRVVSLQDAADQLLKSSTVGSTDSANTYTRLTDLRLRLQSLRRLSGIYVVKLGAVLGYDSENLGVSLHMLSNELLEKSDSRIEPSSSSALQATPHSTDNANTDTAANGEDINTTVLARGYRFFGRVVRASLPIQALMLLLLGVATLVPHGEDYTCMFSNTFARSLEPMLTYPNGPPPT